MRPQGTHGFSDIAQDCQMLNKIAQLRRKLRIDNGSVLLQNKEFVFTLDPKTKMPQRFVEAARIDSKALVEEYMLLANILVAQFIKPFCGDKTLLRAHQDLKSEKK